MLVLVYGFKKVAFFPSEEIKPATRFNVIIPFRNEGENLPGLLKKIAKLNYPIALFEIIFVNDASEDNSEEIILNAIDKSKFSIQLLQNKRVSASPKKDAINEAIKNSKFKWVATTDADCELPQNWLKTLDAFIQKNDPVLVAGPVCYSSNGTFPENFQQLDGLSLQAVTIGSFGLKNPLLCNGANLAYQKEAFLKVNGFSGNDHIASGDDIFLLEKMKKAFPESVKFLKSRDAIVYTKPQKNWKNIINQRVRWASKTSKQKNVFSVLLGILVFLVNISLLALPFLTLFQTENRKFYVSLIAVKILVDYITLKTATGFFKKRLSIPTFILGIYSYALVICIVFIKSLRGNYTWKGRIYEKTG